MPLIFGMGEEGRLNKRAACIAAEALTESQFDMLKTIADKLGIGMTSLCGIAVKWEREGGPFAEETLRWLARLERY